MLLAVRRNLLYNPKLVERARERELRRNSTPAEKKLWNEYLRLLNAKVYRQRPIDQFIVDFYVPSSKLVIELDGESHFTEQGRAYDAERTVVLEGYGLQVIRFTNAEVMNAFEGVCFQISQYFKA